MNAFPIFAVLTIGISGAILRASFDDLRAAPLALDVTGKTALEANEGLLDHELASEDPINAWLGRYLTPSAD
jgi:hypothetical protein